MANKPTQTKTSSFADLHPGLDDFEDLLGITSNPLAKVEPSPESPHKKSSHTADPELRRASAADTRQATSGIEIDDEHASMLHRLRGLAGLGDDEISDAEAARRAGMSHGHGDDRPTPPGTDLVTRQDLPDALKNTVQVAGTRNPKWHTINNLPGYMARAIRAMGRGMFGLITNTPLEDIMTVANVNGQGPNSEEEVRAVAGWLRDNAEDLGELDFDYSQLMPGYSPEVKEYRTDGIRFHVVRDQMGVYIYAYPEQDAKSPADAPAQLGQDRPRLGGPMRESKEIKVKKTLAEEIRQHLNTIEVLQEEVDAARDLQEIMEELAANEAYRGKASKARYMDPEAQKKRMARHSSLGPLLSKEPGGPRLISWLHKQMGLGSQADWGREKAQQYSQATMKNFPDAKQSDKDVSTKWGSGVWADKVRDSRQLWMVIKSHPDNYIVFVGEKGVGAVLPKPGYIEAKKKGNPEYAPEGDQNLLYVYAFFTEDQQWINTNPNEPGIFDPETGKTAKRGGLFHGGDPNFNMINVITGMIGKLKRAYAAYPAEADFPYPPERDLDQGPPAPYSKENPSKEREKIAKRKELSATPADTRTVSQLFNDVVAKITPVLAKLAASSKNRLNQSIKRYVDAGNFDQAARLSKAGTDLANLVATLNGPNAQLDYTMKNRLLGAIKYAAEEHGYNPNNEDELKQFMVSSLTAGAETQSVLDAFRSTLAGASLE